MPLQVPTLDDRRYQDLLDEALARIPVHTPEWTNFNESDPGVTLIEVFAFLTESLLFRCNQIPERNRRKFLQLLGVPLQPAASARGLVTLANERGPLQTITLNRDLEVRAGQVPFRTEQGLDVLPIEAQIYYKRPVPNPAPQVSAYYNQLYASFLRAPLAANALLYETTPFPQFPPRGAGGLDLGQETIDGAVWVALLLRAGDKDRRAEVLDQIEGKTLSLGVVPSLADGNLKLAPGGRVTPESLSLLRYELPVGGTLSTNPSERVPKYRTLDPVAPVNVLTEPGVVQITLPGASELKLWDNLDPLEAGVMGFPPALDDSKLNDRLITWLRVSAQDTAQVKLRWVVRWVGINAAFVTQRAHVANERLPDGTGAPDQTAKLAKTPIVPGSVQITVTARGVAEQWQPIDDLTAAGPEVPVPDPRKPPGTQVVRNDLVKVFTVDPESGEVRFGDGLRGTRPPLGASLRADYDYGVGREGNVNPDAINTGPALPAGLKVTNPVATWGGAEAETVAEGEKQIARYLQHRDRLVNAADFETITRRTPGVDIGRVEALPAYNPELGSNEPGDAPGAVTLMIIPKYDPEQPAAPLPRRLFMDTICRYLDSRRLVTTEVFLRAPEYKQIWVSVGISVVAGQNVSVAEVREAVKRELLKFLSPLPPAQEPAQDAQSAVLAPLLAAAQRGWPLRKPVDKLELMAVASRVPGVSLISGVLLTEGTDPPKDRVEMRGLQLPRVMGISVTAGAPLSLDELRGAATTTTSTSGTGQDGSGQDGSGQATQIVPVPVVPEQCK